jgi:hypothetical protein
MMALALSGPHPSSFMINLKEVPLAGHLQQLKARLSKFIPKWVL